jgi:hypothetical protein
MTRRVQFRSIRGSLRARAGGLLRIRLVLENAILAAAARRLLAKDSSVNVPLLGGQS